MASGLFHSSSSSSDSSSLLRAVPLTLTAVLALSSALWYTVPRPPKPLHDRLLGPNKALGEEDSPMDYEMYDQEDLWWGNEHFPLSLTNAARIPYFSETWKRELEEDQKGKGKEGPVFVDVGCGGGIATEALAKLGYRMIGVDPAKGAIEQAQTHAEEVGLSQEMVEYRVGSAYELPFAASSVRGVVSSDVLEHLPNLPNALSEIHRILEPGGIFVFDTINRTTWSYYATILLAQDWLRMLPRNAHDWKLYITPDELRSALRQAGFEGMEDDQVVKETWTGMGPTWHFWPTTALYRFFVRKMWFVGLMNHWELKGNDLSASYLGWARKPL